MNAAAIPLICESLDAIVTCEGRGVPTGAVAALARGIDAARRSGFPAGDIRIVEAFATDVHRLANLQRRRDGAADFQAEILKRHLSDACWRWLSTLPLGSV